METLINTSSNIVIKNFGLVDSEFKGHSKGMAFVISKEGYLLWIGPQKKIPKALKAKKTIDLKNQLVLPSFIECHTHTIFAGSRAEEFELRNQGVSYLDIAARGGGILSTVKKTRSASLADLVKISQKRVDQFLRQGVSTLEIKSGYGLELKSEIKMLEVAKKLKGPQIITTFLGAHAKASEFETHSKYLQYLEDKVLPVIQKKKLAHRVDIFIEKNFFQTLESEKFLKKAKQLGFDITVHANQLSESEASNLAVSLGALSADHVICLNDSMISRLAQSKTVAVLLPAADLYMKCAYPPARKLIDAGGAVALATDYNPGSCPTQDLMLVGLLARLEMKMTLSEVFKAYTVNAAKALGLAHEQGSLQVGKLANFICTESDLTDFFYSAGSVPEHELFIRGKSISI